MDIEDKFNSFIDTTSKKYRINLRIYLQGTFWLGVSSFIMGIFSLFVTWILTSNISKEDFGFYVFVFTIMSLLSIIVLPEAKTTIVMAISKSRDGSYDYLVGKRLLISLIGSAILVLITLYFYYIKGKYWEPFLLLVFFFPLLSAFSLENSFLNGKERYQDVFKYTLGRRILVWIPVIIITLLTKSLIWILLTYFIGTSFFDIFSYYTTRKQCKNNFVEKDILKYSFELSLITVIPLIAANADKLLVSYFLGLTELANYALIIMLSTQLLTLTSFIKQIALPRMVKMKDVELYNAIKEKAWLLILINILVVAVAIFLTPFVIEFFFPTFTSIILPVQLIFASQIFIYITSLQYTYLIAETKLKLMTFLQTTLSLLKIVIFLLSIPFFGIWGAVIGLIVYEIIRVSTFMYVFFVYLKPRYNIKKHRTS